MSKLRYARGGPDLTNEQRTWAQRHPLYMLGDVVMVYVNEGDLYQLGEEVTGVYCLRDEPETDPDAIIRALVLPTGVASIARADLFNEAANEIEQLTEDLAATGGLNQAFDKERFRLRALLQRVLDWSPGLPAEASLLDEIGAELA